jgi:hypothetical protein
MMDEEQARKIIKSLWDENYVEFDHELGEAGVDGCFTAEQLEAIAWRLRNPPW